MACLKDAALQGYLEDFEPGPFHRDVESRLASCARCRSAFDRVVATNRRVNAWLSRLSSPAETNGVDPSVGLTRVLSRVETTRLFTSGMGGGGTNPKALLSSMLFQGAVVATLLLIGSNDVVRTKITQITLIAPPPALKPAQHSAHQAGGGGQHSPLPPLKGSLPKPAPRVFTPPLATIEHPALVMDASLIAPPDAWAAPTAAIGNPLGVFNGAGGPGSRGGVGPGDGVGIGDRTGSGAGDREAGVFSVGNGVTKPEVISKADPEYSEEARKAKYSGEVVLSIIVGTDGRASDVRVVKSLGMGLDEKAIEAVQRWLFKPGTNKGVPVRVRAQIQVSFRLL